MARRSGEFQRREVSCGLYLSRVGLCRRFGRPLLEKAREMAHPQLFCSMSRKQTRYTSPLKWLTRPTVSPFRPQKRFVDGPMERRMSERLSSVRGIDVTRRMGEWGAPLRGGSSRRRYRACLERNQHETLTGNWKN